MRHIFVICHHKDQNFVRWLTRSIIKEGANLFIDQTDPIMMLEENHAAVRKAIEVSDILIVVVSANSVRSEWVQREVDFAISLQNSGTPDKIIPLVIDRSDVPGSLMGKTVADFRDPAGYADALSTLVRRIMASC